MSVAAKFLMMDQNDSNIDYNNEEFFALNFPAEHYEQEQKKFLKGLEYLMVNLDDDQTETEVATIVYDAARVYDENNIRGFFRRVYNILFSSNDGPRLPTFIVIFGVDEFLYLIERKILNPI